MTYEAGEHIQLQAFRSCTLHGVRFKVNDIIDIRLQNDWDTDDFGKGGGPWGMLGFSAQKVKALAASIKDMQSGKVIAMGNPYYDTGE